MEAKFCFEQVYWVEVQRGNSTCVGDGGKGVNGMSMDYYENDLFTGEDYDDDVFATLNG